MGLMWPFDVRSWPIEEPLLTPASRRVKVLAWTFYALLLALYIAFCSVVVIQNVQRLANPPTSVTFKDGVAIFPNITMCTELDPRAIESVNFFARDWDLSHSLVRELPRQSMASCIPGAMVPNIAVTISTNFPDISACVFTNSSYPGPNSGNRVAAPGKPLLGAVCFALPTYDVQRKVPGSIFKQLDIETRTTIKFISNYTNPFYAWGTAVVHGQKRRVGEYECVDQCPYKLLYSPSTTRSLKGVEKTTATFLPVVQGSIQPEAASSWDYITRYVPTSLGEQLIVEVSPFTMPGLLSQFFAAWGAISVASTILFPLQGGFRELNPYVLRCIGGAARPLD